MRSFSCWTASLTLVALVIGCDTVSPDQCWPNTSGGFGGSGTLPIAAGVGVTSGDFRSAPQAGPLDYSDPPNPCIEPATPCLGKCLTKYEDTAAECGRIANDAQRRTCQDGAHAAYKSCAQTCHQSEVADCLEQCKGDCDKDWGRCRDNCPYGDKNCLAECTNTLASCYKKCKERCK